MSMTDFDLSSMAPEALAALLAYHDRRYWELNDPEISDARYDEIVEALRAKAPNHPLLSRINEVRVVSMGKVHHAIPMLSLDKAYSLEALLEWAQKYARTSEELLLVEPKYDGISAGFDGKVLSTRGDGETGEDISDKLPLIELEAPGYTGKPNRPARGEIVIREDDFRTLYPNIRKKDGGTYKNSRNAAAGIMGLKEIDGMLLQHAKLTLVDYNLISFSVPLSQLASRWEELKNSLAQLPYPMDGIVLKLADEEYRKSLGNTAHHPRGEIAYKFSNQSRESRLLDVLWSFGKNCLTPVAILEPVEISGTTIRKATLHNAQNVEDMQLMIGDSVTVERAGDVIPHIVSSRPGPTRKTPWITECPACRTLLIRKGPELVCPDPECPGVRLQLLLAAVRNLGIERLGEPTLAKLMEKFHIRHLSELFQLSENQLLTVEGFQQKSAANLIQEIQKARECDEVKLLSALNIPNVGPNIAALLLEKYDLSALRHATPEELSAISGIGPERAKAVVGTLQNRSEELDELLNALTIRRSGGAQNDLPTVCFTGKMPEKRSFYEALAQRRGMRAVDAVSSTLSLLVAADVSGSSSKLTAARKFGIRILSLDEFLAQGEPENKQTSLSAYERGELF